MPRITEDGLNLIRGLIRNSPRNISGIFRLRRGALPIDEAACARVDPNPRQLDRAAYEPAGGTGRRRDRTTDLIGWNDAG